MKNKYNVKNGPIIIIIVINIIVFGLIIGGALLIDQIQNHKYNRIDDNPKPEPKITSKVLYDYPACQIVEIKIGSDVLLCFTGKEPRQGTYARRNTVIIQYGSPHNKWIGNKRY